MGSTQGSKSSRRPGLSITPLQVYSSMHSEDTIFTAKDTEELHGYPLCHLKAPVASFSASANLKSLTAFNLRP